MVDNNSINVLITESNENLHLNKELKKYKLILYIVVILFSILILIMLELNKNKHEKYDRFLNTFLRNYYGFIKTDQETISGSDEYWIKAILQNVNANEDDEMVKKYNCYLGVEQSKRNSEFIKLFSSDVKQNKINEDIVYLRFDLFGKYTYENMEQEVKKLSNNTTLIIDLSNNVGGSVEVLKDLLSLFVKKGDILYYLEKGGEKVPITNSKEPMVYCDEIKLIVSNNTASAAEAFAQTLNSQIENVIIYGEKTYGKAITVTNIPFSDGSEAMFVTGKIFGPKMENYNNVGINPDIIIELNYDEKNYNIISEDEINRVLDLVLDSQ
jgi:hypothetical protein